MIDEVEFYLIDLKSKFNKIDPSKYYLSYSGGKDSHFLYWFIKEYLNDNQIEIVSCNTYLEHEEMTKRMYKYADVVLLPKMKPFEIKEKYGIPCFSKSQDFFIDLVQNGSKAPSVLERFYGTKKSWHNVSKRAKEYVLSGKAHKISPNCCKQLKKLPFKEYEKKTGKKAILGVRGNESILRKTQYKTCFTKDKKFTPLHDLTDELLDKIYSKYNIELPYIYIYISRTGCVGCPYGSYKGETMLELELVNENKRKFIVEYFKESYDVLGIDYNNIQKKLF